MKKFDLCKPRKVDSEIECLAKNLPQNNGAVMKKKAKPCVRCGELMIIPEGITQSLCPQCRGGEMSVNDFVRFKENWNSGIVVTDLLKEYRK